MTRVALVRHGETDWNAQHRFQGHADRPLTPSGFAQAHAAARELVAAGRDWSAVFASPLLRARQTAGVVVNTLGLAAPQPVDELIEQTFGVAEGMPVAEARRRWPDGLFPGGETPAQVAERALVAWRRMTAAAASDLIAVCHGALIRHLVAGLTGADPGMLANGGLVQLDDASGAWAIVADEGAAA
ncbi:MAG TPA: histidine phosphatase family protein [Gryllotalpicola sp.]